MLQEGTAWHQFLLLTVGPVSLLLLPNIHKGYWPTHAFALVIIFLGLFDAIHYSFFFLNSLLPCLCDSVKL